MKLLLIDDDAFLRDMYATKFSEAGHTVETAESAADGLAVLEKSQEYDAMLLDMIMPGMTGVELISTIKKEYPDLQTAMIVLSNQGQAEDVASAKQAGAAGYIIKAESIPSEVVKKVESLVNKS